jgi:hypothetical protein
MLDRHLRRRACRSGLRAVAAVPSQPYDHAFLTRPGKPGRVPFEPG